jgi:hypothetical protein
MESGAFVGAVPLSSVLAPRGRTMDTKPKDDKPTEFDLEIAVFAAP